MQFVTCTCKFRKRSTNSGHVYWCKGHCHLSEIFTLTLVKDVASFQYWPKLCCVLFKCNFNTRNVACWSVNVLANLIFISFYCRKPQKWEKKLRYFKTKSKFYGLKWMQKTGMRNWQVLWNVSLRYSCELDTHLVFSFTGFCRKLD